MEWDHGRIEKSRLFFMFDKSLSAVTPVLKQKSYQSMLESDCSPVLVDPPSRAESE
jgi:hypothetical protein